MDREATIHELLDGGDWACAHGDGEALLRVACDLARRLPPPASVLAAAVSATCGRDLDLATFEWARLADHVRRELGEPAAAPSVAGDDSTASS